MSYQVIESLSVFFILVGILYLLIPGGGLPIIKKIEKLGGFLLSIGFLGLAVALLFKFLIR